MNLLFEEDKMVPLEPDVLVDFMTKSYRIQTGNPNWIVIIVNTHLNSIQHSEDYPGSSSLYTIAYNSTEDLRKNIIETAPIAILIASFIDSNVRIEDRLSLYGDKILWIRVGSYNTWIYFDNSNTLILYRKILIEKVNREIQEVRSVASTGIVRIYPGHP